MRRVASAAKALGGSISTLRRWQKNARKKLAKLHARRRVASAHIRKDALHKLTTYLTQNYGIIGIEDLNVRGMAN